MVSGDFPYYLRRHLKERFGEDLTVLYLLGPSGNQSPRFFVRGQTFAEAERLGRRLGEAVAASVERLDPSQYRREGELRGRIAPVELTPRVVPSVVIADCRSSNSGEHMLHLVHHDRHPVEMGPAIERRTHGAGGAGLSKTSRQICGTPR